MRSIMVIGNGYKIRKKKKLNIEKLKYELTISLRIHWWGQGGQKVDELGIEPKTFRMLSERSTN